MRSLGLSALCARARLFSCVRRRRSLTRSHVPQKVDLPERLLAQSKAMSTASDLKDANDLQATISSLCAYAE